MFFASEAVAAPRREAGGGKGGPHQRVGHQQAKGAGTAEPAAPRAEPALQSAVRAAPEPYRHAGHKELCGE